MGHTPMALTSVLETVLYAGDLNKIEAFYTDVLGLNCIAYEPSRQVFYRLGNQMLLIFNPKTTRHGSPEGSAIPVPPHGAEGEGHVCFAASNAEIDAMCRRLKDLGVEIEADFTWPNGGRSVYFRDPAGNCLELAEPRIWGIEP